MLSYKSKYPLTRWLQGVTATEEFPLCQGGISYWRRGERGQGLARRSIGSQTPKQAGKRPGARSAPRVKTAPEPGHRTHAPRPCGHRPNADGSELSGIRRHGGLPRPARRSQAASAAYLGTDGSLCFPSLPAHLQMQGSSASELTIIIKTFMKSFIKHSIKIVFY